MPAPISPNDKMPTFVGTLVLAILTRDIYLVDFFVIERGGVDKSDVPL